MFIEGVGGVGVGALHAQVFFTVHAETHQRTAFRVNGAKSASRGTLIQLARFFLHDAVTFLRHLLFCGVSGRRAFLVVGLFHLEKGVPELSLQTLGFVHGGAGLLVMSGSGLVRGCFEAGVAEEAGVVVLVRLVAFFTLLQRLFAVTVRSE